MSIASSRYSFIDTLSFQTCALRYKEPQERAKLPRDCNAYSGLNRWIGLEYIINLLFIHFVC